MKPAGPVHVYVELPTVLEVKLISLPEQTGPLFDAVGTEGVGFTFTDTVPAGPVGHPGTVADTEYVPATAVVTGVIIGFCEAEVKMFGPLQLYAALAMVLAVRLNVCTVQAGALLPAIGAAGGGFTTTVTVPEALVHPFAEEDTE